jgi:copper chaperone CopZ
MSEQVLLVDGMHCGGCAASVERALRALDGIEQVTVELAAGRVTVVGSDALNAAELSAAIEGLGFEIRAA